MPRKKRNPTIVDVARKAGVSLGTVSRVINGNASVKSSLRDQVLAAARKLGYAPSPAAQAMRSRSSRAVGVLVPDVSNPLFASTIAGAEDVLYRAGYTMILSSSRYSSEKERAILALFLARRFDGMIITPGREDDAEALALIRMAGAPMVLLERESELALDSVATDHQAGVQQAVGYLLGLGHRRISLITVTQAILTGRERARGYASACKNAGITVDPALQSFEGLEPDASYQAAYRMLAARRPPTAIVAGANQMPEVLRAVRELALTVPRRISLVSIGDTDVAGLHQPPLSAVRWDLQKVGATAAELLLTRLAGMVQSKQPRRITLPTELVLRASCAPPSRG